MADLPCHLPVNINSIKHYVLGNVDNLISKKYTSLYQDVNYTIVVGPVHVTWCAKINYVAGFRQYSVIFPGNMASRDPCSRRTWCKPRDTVHLRRFFGSTAVLGISIHILCCCIMDDDTNVLHLFRDITKQILTVSLDQHWKIIPLSCSVLPLALGQHYTTSGHIFTMLPSAPVNSCILFLFIKYIRRFLNIHWQTELVTVYKKMCWISQSIETYSIRHWDELSRTRLRKRRTLRVVWKCSNWMETSGLWSSEKALCQARPDYVIFSIVPPY